MSVPARTAVNRSFLMMRCLGLTRTPLLLSTHDSECVTQAMSNNQPAIMKGTNDTLSLLEFDMAFIDCQCHH